MDSSQPSYGATYPVSQRDSPHLASALLSHSVMRNLTPSQASIHDQYVYIRVRRSLLQSIPVDRVNLPITPPSGHLYLIQGKIQEIRQYAGSTVDWVIKIAHLICAPTSIGQVYTHAKGMPGDWYDRDRGTDWREVHQGDPLLPGIYEFESSTPILLSQLSKRHTRSKTSLGSESDASTFSQGILGRDGTCVVTSSPWALIASHLIPKRMGADGVKAVVREFVGAQAANHIHRFHPSIGICLNSNLSERVGQYILGFYHNAGDTYTLHNFDTTAPDLTFDGSGIPLFSSINLPRLHSYPVTLSVQSGTESLPPKGIFDWHYLQCVAKRFATLDYKTFGNIYFSVLPFKTDDDTDDTDDELELEDYDGIEPPYPTYHFDRYLAEEGEKRMVLERAEVVAQWASGVQSPDFVS